jgi:membrane-associated phospholipid phosphatase
VSNTTSLGSQRTKILVCLVFLISFLLTTLLRASLSSIDLTVNLWIPTIRSDGLTFLAEGIALVFDTTSLVLISLVISGILVLKNYKPQGLLLLGAMAGDALIVSATKTLEQVARPTNGILPDSGFSYPSGHSAGCIVFMGVLAYFAWQHWQSRRSKIVIGAGLGVTVAGVGFDRVYLGVHWLSDVLGGWLFGAFWLVFVILFFIWLDGTGAFRGGRFNLVAKLLYVAAVLVALVVVLLGFSIL